MKQQIPKEVWIDKLQEDFKRRIAIVLFEDLLAYQFAKVHFCCLKYCLRGRHICLTRICDFVIHSNSSRFIANKDVLLALLTK